MPHYAIGDLQGCLTPLLELLDHIRFDASQDTLWFAGDLVNRGPASLETLRFVQQLGKSAKVVLGNHDLHMLALWCGVHPAQDGDTLTEVLAAPDVPELMDWLRKQALVLELPGCEPGLLVHAGILPGWSFKQALALSQEVQHVLSAPDWQVFMAYLYGNEPALWNSSLNGHERLRAIVNVFTRMRMVYPDKRLDFKHTHLAQGRDAGLLPWFDHPDYSHTQGMVVFGHWSTLGQVRNRAGYCLDTGCVWGGSLTALRLNDKKLFEVKP